MTPPPPAWKRRCQLARYGGHALALSWWSTGAGVVRPAFGRAYHAAGYCRLGNGRPPSFACSCEDCRGESE